MVSWLPLSHDMGILAFLALPMQYGIELVASRPEEFLRRLALWADLIGRYRGTITSGPNFAYVLLALTLERAEPAASICPACAWRSTAPNPSTPATSRLAEAGARFGLRPGAVTPAYGMAEATLAITFDNCHRSPSTGSVAAIFRNAHWPRRTPERTRAGWSRSVSRWQAWRSASSTIDPGRVRRVTSGRSRSAFGGAPRIPH
jgi:acyl-CoA synthetase (AMP-forming)/AMP-acid ligase II